MSKFFVIYENTVHVITADNMEVSKSSCRFYNTGIPVNPVEGTLYEPILVAKYSKYLACFSANSVEWHDSSEVDTELGSSDDIIVAKTKPTDKQWFNTTAENGAFGSIEAIDYAFSLLATQTDNPEISLCDSDIRLLFSHSFDQIIYRGIPIKRIEDI